MAALPKARLITGVSLAVIVLAATHAVFSVYRIVTTTAPDFAYYYQASQSFVSQVTDPIHLLPPASLLAYSPHHLLPYQLAQGLWIVVSVVCLVLTVWKLCKLLGVSNIWNIGLMSVLAYVSFPTRFTLGMGQVNLIALAIIVYAVSFMRKKYTVLPGVLFAYSILLKPELVLVLPVIIWARKWPLLWVIGGTFVIVELIARGVLGGSDYVGVSVIYEGFILGWGNAGVYYNQGLSGLLVRAGLTHPWVYIALLLGILMTTMIVRIKRPLQFEPLLWSSLLILILIEPIAWQHHFVFLLPTLLWLWVGKLSPVLRVAVAVSYVLISWNFAVPGFLDTMPLGWLVASHATLGVIVLWVVTLL